MTLLPTELELPLMSNVDQTFVNGTGVDIILYILIVFGFTRQVRYTHTQQRTDECQFNFNDLSLKYTVNG